MTYAQTYPGAAPIAVRRRLWTPVTIVAFVVAGGIVAILAATTSVVVAGVLYAALFMGLAYARPDLAMFVIFASAPFVYDLGIGPVKIALSDLSLVLATPGLVLRSSGSFRRFVFNPVLIPVLAYFGICVGSTLINGGMRDSVTSMLQMAVYLLLALYVFSSCITDERVFRAILQGWLSAGVFLAAVILISGNFFVLGLHKNSIGASLAMAVVVSVELWLARTAQGKRARLQLIVTCVLLAGLVCTLSRGAWLGAVIGIFVILLLRRRFTLLVRVMLIAIPVVALSWVLLPEQARDYAVDLSPDSHNVKARLMSIEYAMSFFKQSPLWGVGVGLRKQYDATNIVMSTLAETGVLGLVAFSSIFAVFYFAIWRGQRGASRADPAFSLLAIGAALVIGRLVHGCVDHYWSRGVLPVWASLGFALYATGRLRASGRLR